MSQLCNTIVRINNTTDCQQKYKPITQELQSWKIYTSRSEVESEILNSTRTSYGVASAATSYVNTPSVKIDYGTVTVAFGNSFGIEMFPCPAGTAVSFELKASGDTHLKYFQVWNPSPVDLYNTKCLEADLREA
jgi:hypothetical protein